jgi:hypothetical protein
MGVRLRFLMCFCFVLLGIYGFYDVQGDPPQFLPLPEVELRPVPEVVDDDELENSRAFQAIRAASEGKLPESPVADPILGDVMQVIAERHRELGLDWDLEQGTTPIGVTAVGTEVRSQRAHHPNNAKAAEQLLKASRILENLAKMSGESPDLTRMDLVNRMRAEAVKLLSE